MTHPCPTCNGSGFVEVTPVSVMAPPKPGPDQKPKPVTKSRGVHPFDLSHLRKL